MEAWKVYIEKLKKKPYSALGLLLIIALPLFLAMVFRVQDVRTKAALPNALETEAGVLTGDVSKQSDSNASGRQFVRFDASQSVTPTQPPSSSDVSYTDVSLAGVTSHDGYPIDPTGNVDSTEGINRWIQANAGGTDRKNHKRLIFPGNAKYKISGAICLGTGSGVNMDHTTFWGHRTTLNNGTDPDSIVASAWIRGDSSTYPEPGVIISPEHRQSPGSPYNAAFSTGCYWKGPTPAQLGTYSFGQNMQDIVIRGFDIVGNMPNQYAYYGKQAGFHFGAINEFEVLFNRADMMGGDFVTFRSSSNGHFHHNYGKRFGRMGVTVTVQHPDYSRMDHLVEYNTIDNVNYWGLDVEPQDEKTSANRKVIGFVMRNNRFGTFGSKNISPSNGGGFIVIGGTAEIITDWEMRDIKILDNIVDGYNYSSTYDTSRNLWMLVTQSTNYSSYPEGQIPPRSQDIEIRGNIVSHEFPYPRTYVLDANDSDNLIIRDNVANYTGGDWASTTRCYNLDEGNNK